MDSVWLLHEKYANTTSNMKELYRDEPARVSILLDVTNIPITGDVTVEVYRNNVLVADGVGTETEQGLYEIILPVSVVRNDGALKVIWTYFQGSVVSRDQYYEVVTPYVTIEEIQETFPNLANKSELELREMERRVRHVINSVTGQDFGRREESITLNASASDFTLPRRLYRLDWVKVDGAPVNLATFGIRTSNSGWNLFTTTSFRSWYDVKSDVYFRATGMRTYEIYGMFGWEYVPNEINWAAKMLVATYFCPEDAYRVTNTTSVRASDWRLEWGDLRFEGTGNIDVDKVLSSWRAPSIMVI